MKVLERKKIVSSKEGFSVMQFNTLADRCATTDSKFGFAFVNPECLKWKYRFPGLISEIKTHGGDIISLEEIDRYSEFKEELEKCGYKSIYYLPRSSKLGNAVFWNPKKFKMINNESLHFRGLVCLFEFLPLKKTLVFGSCHLKAKVGNEQHRLLQVQQLWALLKRFTENGKFPVVLAGDFNDIQKSPMYEYLVKHAGLDSAYGKNKEPYTTYKKRKTEDVCRTIDFIFYDNEGTKVDEILEIPDKETFVERLPAMNYPSDHLMIKASFTFI